MERFLPKQNNQGKLQPKLDHRSQTSHPLPLNMKRFPTSEKPKRKRIKLNTASPKEPTRTKWTSKLKALTSAQF